MQAQSTESGNVAWVRNMNSGRVGWDVESTEQLDG